MIDLSFRDRVSLGKYIEAHRLGIPYFVNQQKLLQKLRSNGIDMPTLESIPIDVRHNPLQLEFPSSYLVDRIVLAYALQEHLREKGEDTKLTNCYLGIDKLIEDEYKRIERVHEESSVPIRYPRPSDIITPIHFYINNPNIKPNSMRYRWKNTAKTDVFFGATFLASIGSFLAYEKTQSMPYAIITFAIWFGGGIFLGVYVDTWGSYELPIKLRKILDIAEEDEKSVKSLLEIKLAREKEKYRRLCNLVLGLI